MSGTYGFVNYISSFGFTRRWRRQCIELAALAELPADARVCDLMTGMGECWDEIYRQGGPQIRLDAIDFSPVMIQAARAKREQAVFRTRQITVIEGDVFQYAPEQNQYDAVVCAFGLKTLAPAQYEELAKLLLRLLKPGGRFALIEIAVPSSALLRWPLLLYVSYLIPLIGRACLGNPDNYRMLGVYTRAFGNARPVCEAFRAAGLEASTVPFFWGSASALAGRKPI